MHTFIYFLDLRLNKNSLDFPPPHFTRKAKNGIYEDMSKLRNVNDMTLKKKNSIFLV